MEFRVHCVVKVCRLSRTWMEGTYDIPYKDVLFLGENSWSKRSDARFRQNADYKLQLQNPKSFLGDSSVVLTGGLLIIWHLYYWIVVFNIRMRIYRTHTNPIPIRSDALFNFQSLKVMVLRWLFAVKIYTSKQPEISQCKVLVTQLGNHQWILCVGVIIISLMGQAKGNQ